MNEFVFYCDGFAPILAAVNRNRAHLSWHQFKTSGISYIEVMKGINIIMVRNYNNMSRPMESPCGLGRDYSCNMANDMEMPDGFVVAMAYVPWQHFTDMYEPEKALFAGTIFPELDLPFYGGKGGMRR